MSKLRETLEAGAFPVVVELKPPKGTSVDEMLAVVRALAGRVTCVDHENELLPGVRMLAAPGHTPGHAVVEFASRGQKLFYSGDTVLYPFHLEHTDWLPIYDILPEKAAPSKRRIFDLAAGTGALVLGQHFPPFPNLGHIAKKGEGWAWEPIMPYSLVSGK